MLIHPLITEKSARMSEGGSYAFRVHDHARKPEIKKAVEELYGVRVEKVRLLYAPPKRRTHRGKEGIKPGYKKAMVMLRKGGKIEFI
ncbi:MAG: 50S ribosomal protein L23 [Candidatus Niyogibacteria bacterium]|nr:50S ribosomal protein L23 [Candidatus Niyogibacteria bacterium]